jgi:hypothetical protein
VNLRAPVKGAPKGSILGNPSLTHSIYRILLNTHVTPSDLLFYTVPPRILPKFTLIHLQSQRLYTSKADSEKMVCNHDTLLNVRKKKALLLTLDFHYPFVLRSNSWIPSYFPTLKL